MDEYTKTVIMAYQEAVESLISTGSINSSDSISKAVYGLECETDRRMVRREEYAGLSELRESLLWLMDRCHE